MVSTTSTLSKLIRTRPLAIETLEKSGHPFLNCLDMTVESFCKQANIDPVTLIQSVEITGMPQPNVEWRAQRFYRIIDFLKAEHRQFREKDLPLFNQLFEHHRSKNGSDLGMKLVEETYHLFERTFLEHLQDEEVHVFPYLLLLEEAFLLGKEANFNSIHMTSPVILAELKHAYEEPLNRLALDCGMLGDELQDFRLRLNQHAERESDILFSKAREMEKQFDLKQSKSIRRKFERSYHRLKNVILGGTQPWE